MDQYRPAADVAGGCGPYATGGSGNDAFCFSLVAQPWTKVGGPARFARWTMSGRLYGLSPDGGGVFHYDGAWNAP